MEDEDRYSITDLSERTGVGRRTIHHYVSQGLLPPAEGAGPGAYYRDEHLLRLRLVSLLQAAGLRTDTIRKALDGWSVEEMDRLVSLAEGRSVVDLDTLGGWLMGRHFEDPEASQHYGDLGSLQEQAASLLESSAQMAEPGASEPIAQQTMDGAGLSQAQPDTSLEDALQSFAAEMGSERVAEQRSPAREDTKDVAQEMGVQESRLELGSLLKRPTGKKKKRRLWERGSRGRDTLSLSAPATYSAAEPATSTWHRHSLSDDVEIHFRAPRDPLGFKRLRRLFDAAREIFSPDARDSPAGKSPKSKKK